MFFMLYLKAFSNSSAHGLYPTVQDVSKDIHLDLDYNTSSLVQQGKMAAMYVLVFTILVVTLFGGGLGVTDEEFQVGFIDLSLFEAKITMFSQIKTNKV